MQSAFVPDERRFGWPRMTVSGYAPVGSPSFSAQLRFDNVWHMSDMLSVTRGKSPVEDRWRGADVHDQHLHRQ